MGRLCSKCSFESWTTNTFSHGMYVIRGDWVPRPAHKSQSSPQWIVSLILRPKANHQGGHGFCGKMCSEFQLVTPGKRFLLAPLQRGNCLALDPAGACGCAHAQMVPMTGGHCGTASSLLSLLLLLVAPAHHAFHSSMEHARSEHSLQQSAQEPQMVSLPQDPNFLFQYSRPFKIYFFPW